MRFLSSYPVFRRVKSYACLNSGQVDLVLPFLLLSVVSDEPAHILSDAKCLCLLQCFFCFL